MSIDIELLLLAEAFFLLCFFGSFKAQNENTQHIFLGAFMISFSLLMISLGISSIKTDDMMLLLIGVAFVVFGGISLIMGVENVFLFWKSD